MPDRPILTAAPLEGACLTLDELCSACAVGPDWVAAHVIEGRLYAAGTERSQWRFSSHELTRVRQIRRLEIAFDADPDLAALVADLLEELESLRAQLRRAAGG
jgi:chaperone modulatory protein CbpM